MSPARNAGVGALHRAHVARLSVSCAFPIDLDILGHPLAGVDFWGQSEQGDDAVRDEGTGLGGGRDGRFKV